MKETFTLENYLMFLELAPSNVLKETGSYIAKIVEQFSENTSEFEALSMMLSMLIYELQLRQIEPLWRKAKRFAVRNSETFKKVGKIAACIGAGVILGASLDD